MGHPNGHYLRQAHIHVQGKSGGSAYPTVHETGSLVVCAKCGEAFLLIAADKYAQLLVRAIAGPQKGEGR